MAGWILDADHGVRRALAIGAPTDPMTGDQELLKVTLDSMRHSEAVEIVAARHQKPIAHRNNVLSRWDKTEFLKVAPGLTGLTMSSR
jgi:hypothetical protein